MKSVLQATTNECYVCHKTGALHPHHIFNGALKKKSEEYGFIIYVHDIPCHRNIHDKPNEAIKYKKIAQKVFEEQHTREQFIKEFKKNYL